MQKPYFSSAISTELLSSDESKSARKKDYFWEIA